MLLGDKRHMPRAVLNSAVGETRTRDLSITSPAHHAIKPVDGEVNGSEFVYFSILVHLGFNVARITGVITKFPEAYQYVDC